MSRWLSGAPEGWADAAPQPESQTPAETAALDDPAPAETVALDEPAPAEETDEQ